MSLLLLKNAQLYAPEFMGTQSVLIAGGRIIAIDANIRLSSSVQFEEFDCEQRILCPGFVDTLTHVTGGGGEGGFATRTPEMQLSDAILGGVTTVTGALGTDGVCRTHKELLAKVKALKEEGLSAYFYTGNYHYPTVTLTGSVEQDIMLIDECIGVGEVAIADHRGSQMSWQELARLASQARVAGMCSNKAGIVSIHTGAGDEMLAPLFDVAYNSSIPLNAFYPTHINRNAALLDQGIDFNLQGGTIDFTASTTPEILAGGEVLCAEALKMALEAGADENRITFSTDGHASLPVFNAQGELTSLKCGSMSSLHNQLITAVNELDISLTTALKTITANPARILKLTGKGNVTVNADADLLLLDEKTLQLNAVLAKGQWMMQQGTLLRRGTFEKAE
ncbi:beta-aspartyl-peptidase [Reinekea marinisedimentorum]|uniref:Isoaspartyl dipeptidase n=1 Tax=Reinekea marinisedimentorum TaxID=230495 RepID=A0A4R3I408_9GAMM|nr:beta-aspartyl-peptidase [Reinekea marinisedimentorum]TCS40320.1 beta-aspartyl-dipeptidase (metallo-type) [Reinekea marinisedimentorum]